MRNPSGRSAAAAISVVFSLALPGSASAEFPRHTSSIWEARSSQSEQLEDTGISPIPEVLLVELSLWLASEFDLPFIEELPTIEMVPSQAMPSFFRLAVQSYGELASKAAGSALEGQTSETVLAFYRTDTETIYLTSGWQISDVKGMSILVHEYVHHIQHKAGMRYFCPAEREQVALEAQQRWLVMNGRTLEEEFGLDAFTLIFLTKCLF
jgi:hypothetical protein